MGELGSEVVKWEEAFPVLVSAPDIALATANWQHSPESQPVIVASPGVAKQNLNSLAAHLSLGPACASSE